MPAWLKANLCQAKIWTSLKYLTRNSFSSKILARPYFFSLVSSKPNTNLHCLAKILDCPSFRILIFLGWL